MAERVAAPRIEVSGLRKAFGATVALDEVSFTAHAGEVHALLGENGAGKSSLMKVLAGATRADAGTMRIDGRPYEPKGPDDARRAGVAMVYQELSLCPDLTVGENILLGVEPTRFGLLDRAEARRRVARALEPIVSPELEATLHPDARVSDLPPASRQLVEIARALAQDPCRVLILDEPTSSLGKGDVERLFGVLRALRAKGITILYVSHFLEEVQAVADAYTVLRDGHTVGHGAVAGTTVATLVHEMAGRHVDALYPRSPRSPGDVILEVTGLSGVAKPKDASLRLHRGEVVGIAGLVGAGRTELLRALFGLDRVRAGAVRIGAYVGPASPANRLAHGMGFLSEDRKGEGLCTALSVADNLTLSKLSGLGPAGLVLEAPQHAAAARWIEALGIRCRGPSQPVGDLSGGNQQKVALARLLHHDVDVLLLDEPTRGIDVGSKAQIYALIDAQASLGKAVLVVSSYLPELLGVCDRIAVMCRGKLGPLREVGSVTEHGLLLEATGG